MKSVEAVVARSERNKLEGLAGKHFRSPETELIKKLKSKNLSAILGIENDDSFYTVLGFEGLLVKNLSGEELVITFDELLLLLRKNGMAIGKAGDFEVVPLEKYGKIWMKDGPTMCAIWNIAIMMERWPVDEEPKGVY